MTIRERILGSAQGYKALKTVLRTERTMARLAAEHLRVQPGDRVLDVGCGYGDIRPHLGEVTYVGVDTNGDYLRLARERVGDDRTTFVQASVVDLPALGFTGFDCVLALGVLHHLTDEEAAGLAAAIPGVTRPGGRFVALDGVWDPSQGATARVLAALDRGRYVRDEAGYRRVVEGSLVDVRTVVRHDLLAVPYSHCILEGTVP